MVRFESHPAELWKIGFNTCLSYFRKVTILKWVTREFVHVDRTACPWLIKKFIDPQAEFIFVPTEKIGETVKDQGAIPFDAPRVKLGHRDGKCSFCPKCWMLPIVLRSVQLITK